MGFFLQTVFSCTFFARKSIGDYNLISILGPLIASLPRGGLVWFISTMLLPDMELKVLSSRYKYKYLKLVLKYKYRVSGLYLLWMEEDILEVLRKIKVEIEFVSLLKAVTFACPGSWSWWGLSDVECYCYANHLENIILNKFHINYYKLINILLLLLLLHFIIIITYYIL